MPFIIDGYNLLHFIQKTSEDFGAITDVQFCRVISGYLRLVNEKGEIVFDGTGPRDKCGFDNISNLEVFFAGLRSDADTVIEDKIKASTAPRRLTIVSSDRRLRDAARKRRATVVKSQVFWDNVGKQLSRKAKVKEPRAKREGLSEGETEQWLKIFDL
ncbi:MAG: NYN domain-containing protein [Phycisphaerae bacterium]|nr:NYN domain-containing protein [Phycisphaerae bacterium]MDD5380833.1 NYN domain-containing protein [Phycisphaerae bacterium]